MKVTIFCLVLFNITLFTLCGFVQADHFGPDKRGFDNKSINTYSEKAEKINDAHFYDLEQNRGLGFGDNVSRVFSGKVRSFATATEESEPNKGRIWSIIGVENPVPSNPDFINLYYSDDNGASWNTFISGILAANQVLFPDQIDAEIVGNSENKYLYIAFTYAAGSYISGPKRTGLFVADITNGFGALYYLSFPGGADNQYYDLRITSSNEKDREAPWVFLVSTIDSTLGNGDIVCMQRSAFIHKPYTFLSNPLVFYSTKVLQQYITVSGAQGAKGKSDIVFLRVYAGDHIYYSLSHPNSDGIWINNTWINGDFTAKQPYHIDIGVTITDHKMAASLDGGVAQIMLLATRNIGNNNDLVSYKLNMNNNASSQFAWITSGTGGSVPRQPKIVSPRGVNDDYRVSYMMNIASNPNHADSIIFIESIKDPANQWGPSSRVSMKTGGYNWRSKYSAVGIKLNSEDNTLVFWGEASVDFGFIGNDVWCTVNSGIPT